MSLSRWATDLKEDFLQPGNNSEEDSHNLASLVPMCQYCCHSVCPIFPSIGQPHVASPPAVWIHGIKIPIHFCHMNPHAVYCTGRAEYNVISEPFSSTNKCVERPMPLDNTAFLYRIDYCVRI